MNETTITDKPQTAYSECYAQPFDTVIHGNFLNNTLPDKCANLIIADPPYFEVKGAFDFVWNSFEDYLKDVEKWAIECKRILADNGTLFWYGHAKKIAYAQIIFDKYFNLINNLVWNKGSFMGLEESEGLRSFAPCTERILMYSVGDDYHDNVRLSIKYIQDYLATITTRNELAEILLQTGNCRNAESAKQNANNILSQRSHKPQMITEYQYNLIPNPHKKEYEALRTEYEALRRPFANHFKLQEIFRFSNEAVKTGAKYDHDTVKPEKLTRTLILTCSRPNDLILVPFAGSGTECAMAIKENRNFIGFEIDAKHFKTATDRTEIIKSQPSLFF
jgi:site-specific DNA-methyltransferase (adenine-specific)